MPTHRRTQSALPTTPSSSVARSSTSQHNAFPQTSTTSPLTPRHPNTPTATSTRNPNHTAPFIAPHHQRPRSNSLLPRTHHCPICHRLSKHRCYTKGHLESCELHPGHVRRAGWGCPGCEAEGERRFYAERREREAEKTGKGPKKSDWDDKENKESTGKGDEARKVEEKGERGGWLGKMKGKSKGGKVRYPQKRTVN